MTTALNLEKFIIPHTELDRDHVPKKALWIFDEETKQRVPTAIGYHSDIGWFVIQSSGQGPYLIWQQRGGGARYHGKIRKRKYEVHEVLDFVGLGGREFDVKEYDGEQVKMRSGRYACFKFRGIKCVACGIEGKYFWLERDRSVDRFHFNLYAVDENGVEVLMTKDHIVPKSKGGRDCAANYQTMCIRCNEKKGDKT